MKLRKYYDRSVAIYAVIESSSQASMPSSNAFSVISVRQATLALIGALDDQAVLDCLYTIHALGNFFSLLRHAL